QQRIQQSRQQLWNQRNIGIQNFAINQMAQQRAGVSLSGMPHVTEGVTRPIWIDDHLILARRVIYGSQVVVQGCWLDWGKLREVLLADISGYLRRVKLVPVNDEREVFPERMLATLPVELVVDPEEARELAVNPGRAGAEAVIAPSSAIRGSLLIAWCCIVLAACSIAAVLQGVVTLSERRGAFVSTVTHELRTPLTTFRMYSEMLATGMVQDEAKKRSYLETLQVEAERLSHLVENVLQYARLERGKRGTQREAVDVRDLWQRVVSRLTDRAQQVEMQLVADFSDDVEDAVMRTDPAAVEQILFNLVDNACKYARSVADATIEVNWLARDAHVEIRVTDRGPGIPPEKVRHLFRPFSKSVHDPANTAPGVGLGLALCRQLAQALGGQLRYESPGGQGATFVLTV
ncbi:MAG: HAMP domain-containing histidine kinase, partial [Planctomycetaceae bacterium]|nr:HAMP domain-containing histidine kinase [Planctomycetaceae bacterium]